jgi:glycosyltransferase 2 family protein
MRWARSKGLRRLYTSVLVLALGYALVSQREVIARDLARLDAASVVAAWAALVAGLGLSMLSWRAVLADLGSPLPVPVAARIFFVGQLGKYVPGSVWPLLTQMELGKAAGVPRARMGAAGLVAMGLSAVTGLLLGMLALPALLSQDAGAAYALTAAVLLVLGTVALHPRVLNAVLGLGFRLTRRPPLEQGVSARGVLAGGGWLVGCWTVFGAQLALLVHALGGESSQLLPQSIGAFALASTLGLLVVFLPAGAGVREVVLVLALSPVLDVGTATAAAVVSRLLVTLADGAVAGLAVLAVRGRGAPAR